jgi:hypothetical protein
MRSSSGILADGALAAWRSEGLQLAWLDAADDARDAYLAWQDTDRPEQSDAFLVYQAALDREEAAAQALQLQMSDRSPRSQISRTLR